MRGSLTLLSCPFFSFDISVKKILFFRFLGFFGCALFLHFFHGFFKAGGEFLFAVRLFLFDRFFAF